MKMKNNFLKLIGIGGTIIGLTYLIARYVRKEKRLLQQERENLQQEAEKSGISLSTIERELDCEEEENTFIKGVATSMFFNQNIPLEYLNPDDIFSLGADEGGIIHVAESTWRSKKYLDVLFELPNFIKGRYSGPNWPRINEYIRGIKTVAEKINDEHIKGPKPLTKPELYVGVRYVERFDKNVEDCSEKELQSSYFLIPSSAYAEYATEGHDGLADYYCDLVVNNQIEENENNLREVLSPYINMKTNHFQITDVRVMIKSSFKIQKSGNLGLTFLSVPKVLLEFIEELEIKPKRFNNNNREGVRFEHCLFHPRIEDQEEQGEIPCTIYERVNGTLIKSDYLI